MQWGRQLWGRARPSLLIWGAAVTTVAVFLPVRASAHVSGAILYGSGTAAVDGMLTPGEWQNARALSFQAARAPSDGGGTMPVTMREMNDGANVFISLEIGRGTYGGATQATFFFDNDHNGSIAEGDEYLSVNVGTYSPLALFDGFRTGCTPGAPPFCPSRDSDFGGTSDGLAAAVANGTTTVLEISHPLDSADNAHDWSLSSGQVVGFANVLDLWSATPSCNSFPDCVGRTVLPAGALQADASSTLGYGDLVVAPDTIPPETEVVSGPEKLTRSANADFEFSGSDNLTPPAQIAFSCSLDGSAFAPCSQDLTTYGGQHRLEVRGTDELGNVEQTPAEYSWRVDLTRPTTPRMRVRLAGGRVRVSLSARDEDDPAQTLRFLCSLDRHQMRSCPARFTRPVRKGRHRLRARAIDPAGNVSATALKTFSRHR
jgi:hypothetical protein